MADKAKGEKLLMYRGRPLVRFENMLYYGDPAEKYVIMMQILGTEKVGDMEVANKVAVQLQRTDPECKNRDRIVKKSEKDGLYNAMDIACIWLDRALSEA